MFLSALHWLYVVCPVVHIQGSIIWLQNKSRLHCKCMKRSVAKTSKNGKFIGAKADRVLSREVLALQLRV